MRSLRNPTGAPIPRYAATLLAAALCLAAAACCVLAPRPAWAESAPTLDKNGTLVTVIGPDLAKEESGQTDGTLPASETLADTGDGIPPAMAPLAAIGVSAGALAATAAKRRAEP